MHKAYVLTLSNKLVLLVNTRQNCTKLTELRFEVLKYRHAALHVTVKRNNGEICEMFGLQSLILCHFLSYHLSCNDTGDQSIILLLS